MIDAVDEVSAVCERHQLTNRKVMQAIAIVIHKITASLASAEGMPFDLATHDALVLLHMILDQIIAGRAGGDDRLNYGRGRVSDPAIFTGRDMDSFHFIFFRRNVHGNHLPAVRDPQPTARQHAARRGCR